jgi:hypothetical protein
MAASTNSAENLGKILEAIAKIVKFVKKYKNRKAVKQSSLDTINKHAGTELTGDSSNKEINSALQKAQANLQADPNASPEARAQLLAFLYKDIKLFG